MSKVIDFDRGVSTKTETQPDGSTVTTFVVKDVELMNYCPEHQGLVNVEGTIYTWHEDCGCNHA